jgi:hypothetical protein
MTNTRRHLRVIAVDGNLVGPPPPKQVGSIAAALAVMRLSAGILAREPGDTRRGYNPDELAAQYAATDRMVEAFRVLDRLLGRHPSRGVSRNGHPKQSPREKGAEK